MRDIERANGDIKNMQFEIKRVPKAKEIELSGNEYISITLYSNQTISFKISIYLNQYICR